MAYRVYRRRIWDYFLPFFIIIALCLTVILGLRFWHEVRVSREPLDIYLYTLEGKTNILPWGTQDFQTALNESRLLQGDSLQTLPEGRAAVQFFQSFWVRLDENTDFDFKDAVHGTDEDHVSFDLKNGSAWFYLQPSEEKTMFIELNTGRLRVRNKGTVFSVEKNAAKDIVRVLEGKVDVDILSMDEENPRIFETVTVAAGQEMTLTDKIYKDFAAFRAPDVVTGLDPAFSVSDWAAWNKNLDEKSALGKSDS